MKLFAMAVAGLLGSLVLLSGCASTSLNASNRESLLRAAGFRERTPQTAKQQERYAEAPAYQMQHLTVQGRSFYLYKDEKKGAVWLGGEKEYQQYQRLARQQRMTQENYAAVEMDEPHAWGWGDGWGTWSWGGWGWGSWGAGRSLYF